MKFSAVKSKLAVAAPLAVAAVFGVSHLAVAQPPAGGKRAGRKGGLPKKTQEKLETALGKPLTDDQKSQLADAAKERRDAVKAATDKFNQDVARITGLPLDKVEDATKATPKKAGAAN